MKISKANLELLREATLDNGSIRVHVIHARSGMGARARLWHVDGIVLAHATGCGYDKTGTVIGDVANLVFTQEQLLSLALPAAQSNGSQSGLYGLCEYKGKRYIDGGCGIRAVQRIWEALGWSFEEYNTGKYTSMFVLKKVQQ